MFLVVLLLSLCLEPGLSAPTRCTMFCDEDQLSAGYAQQAQVRLQPIQTSYSFFKPSYSRGYVPSSAGMASYQAPTFVQPAHVEVFEPVQPQAPSLGNVEGVIYHSSSSSHNSQTHGMLRFPAVQTGNIVMQSQPVRRNPCISEYYNPCDV